MGIKDNLKKIGATLPQGVKLIAISKTKPVEDIQEAYEAGQRLFGESRPQELAAKYETLPKDIEWHMIGQLQAKNVKYIAPFISLIHSVDSLKLLKKIDWEAKKNNRVIDCLLEFHVAEEESKAGMTVEEAEEILKSEEYKELANVRIVGVMGIATYTDEQAQIKGEFNRLKTIFEYLKEKYFKGDYFKELSMGMSGDYPIAVKEGSTMVRIGGSIFGER